MTERLTKARRGVRRRLTLRAGALAALLVLPGAAVAQTTPVTFALNSWIGFAPLFVASHNHYFGKFPLKYVHMETGINAALLSSSVDVADLSMNQVIEDHVKGFDVKVVMPIDYSNGADAIVASKDVKSVADLRGKTIPLNTESYSELLLVYALHKSGLSIKDVTTTNMPASAVPAALLGGHAEAGVTWSPHIEVVTANPKFHTLYTSADAPGLITDNLSTKTAFLKAHPGAIPAIVTGFLKGRAYIQSHPKEAFAIVAKELGITPKDAATQYKQIVSPSAAEMKAMMSDKGVGKVIPYSENIKLVRQVMIAQGQLKPSQKIIKIEVLQPRYVEAVAGMK